MFEDVPEIDDGVLSLTANISDLPRLWRRCKLVEWLDANFEKDEASGYVNAILAGSKPSSLNDVSPLDCPGYDPEDYERDIAHRILEASGIPYDSGSSSGVEEFITFTLQIVRLLAKRNANRRKMSLTDKVERLQRELADAQAALEEKS